MCYYSCSSFDKRINLHPGLFLSTVEYWPPAWTRSPYVKRGGVAINRTLQTLYKYLTPTPVFQRPLLAGISDWKQPPSHPDKDSNETLLAHDNRRCSVQSPSTCPEMLGLRRPERSGICSCPCPSPGDCDHGVKTEHPLLSRWTMLNRLRKEVGYTGHRFRSGDWQIVEHANLASQSI